MVVAAQCDYCTVYLLHTAPREDKHALSMSEARTVTSLVVERSRGHARSMIFEDWRTVIKQKKSTCVWKIKKGLIHKKAIFRSVCSALYCKPRSYLCISIFWLFCLQSAHKSGEPVRTKPSLCHRAAAHGDSFVPLRVTPFSPSTPPSLPPSHGLNQHPGRPPSRVPQIRLHHGQRAVSPNDCARRARVGGMWIWKQPRWLKWKNRRLEKRKEKNSCEWDLRGNRLNKS